MNVELTSNVLKTKYATWNGKKILGLDFPLCVVIDVATANANIKHCSKNIYN